MSLDVCIPDMPEVTPEADFRENPAQWVYQRLVKQINTFECGLTDEEEVSARLVATPAGVFHIEQIGYWAPDVLIFLGTNAHGKPTQLLQHYTQLNLELTALPKGKEQPRRSIGFIFPAATSRAAQLTATDTEKSAISTPFTQP